MKITNLSEFLEVVEPRCNYSVKIAMYATGLCEPTCRKYLDEAVKLGLYEKEWIKGSGNNAGVARAHKFIGRFHYTKIK